MGEYLLGVDIGTSSCKTVLFSLDGRAVSSASEEYGTKYGAGSRVEQNPEDWWSAACHTIRKILETSGISPEQIRAIGLDSQSSAMIPVDGEGKVLHPAMIWTDHRAGGQEAWLWKHVDFEKQLRINGNRFDASNVGTKILWWKETEPEAYGRTHQILNACGYIVYRFTGAYSCNIAEADLSQLTDQRKGAWSEELLKDYGIAGEKLPPIYSCSEIVGEVSETAARETGLCPGIPVTAGAMDVCASALGSHVCQEGDAVITGGTVTGIALCSEKFVIQETSHVYHHMIPGQWIYCASIDFGGGSLRWFRDQFMEKKGSDNLYNVMDKMAEKVPCGSDNLLFLPYMVGQRCPEWDPNMTGVFFGLKPSHTKAHCIRAIMEGTAFGLRKIVELLKADGLDIERLAVAGGCAKSDVWMDIFGQILSREVLYRSDGAELAPLGAVLAAGVAVGIYSDFDEAVGCTSFEHVRFSLREQEKYEKLSRLFISLYPILKDSFAQLSRLEEH